jgi:hypothetical protein
VLPLVSNVGAVKDLRSPGVRMLDAAFRGEHRTAARISRKELGGDWPFELTCMAFVLAVRRRFEPGTDRRMATRFAWKMVQSAPGAEKFLIRHVDAMVRLGMGDEEAGPSLPAERYADRMYATLLALLDDLELDDRQVAEFLEETERREYEERGRHIVVVKPGEFRFRDIDLRRYQRVHRRYLADKHWLPPRAGELRPPRGPGEGLRTGQPSSLAGRFARAAMLRRLDEGPDVDDVPNVDTVRLAWTTFAVVITRYLYADADIREMTPLVRRAHRADGELDPMKMEYLLRTGMGEHLPMDGVTAREVYKGSSLMLGLMIEDWGRDEAAITAAVLDAEEELAAAGHRLA